jgi:1,2-phenylacetyl-CoA epoxidase catalytic subunit
MVVSLQQTKGYVMGKMKDIMIELEEMVYEEVSQEWDFCQDYVDESRAYIRTHTIDLVNYQLTELGLSMNEKEIEYMVDNSINEIYV